MEDSERDVTRARDELGTKRNQHIRAENDLKETIKNYVKRAIEDTLEWVHLKAEGRGREKGKRCGIRPSGWLNPSTWPWMLSALSDPIVSRRVSMSSGT